MNPNLAVWVTDWHIGNYKQPSQIQALVAFINSLDPAGVFDTGDTKDHFGAGSASELTSWLADTASLPWFAVNPGVNATIPTFPGNHDEKDDVPTPGPGDMSLFNAAFWSPPYHWTFDWPAAQIRVIGHHSRIVHQGEGPALPFTTFFMVDNAERDWLEDELDSVPENWGAIVCSHAPLHTSFGNNIGVWANYNGTEIRAILAARTDRVVAHLSGHRHLNTAALTLDGIPHITGAGVAYVGGQPAGGLMPILYDPVARTLTVDYLRATTPFARNPGYTPIVIQLSDLPSPDNPEYYFRRGEPTRGLA